VISAPPNPELGRRRAVERTCGFWKGVVTLRGQVLERFGESTLFQINVVLAIDEGKARVLVRTPGETFVRAGMRWW